MENESKKKRILIIEDEASQRKVLKLKFESAGIEVEEAIDGDQALEKIAEGEFDLILLDFLLPGTDGISFLNEMKDKNLNIPVVAVTLLNQRNKMEEAKRLGVKDYIIKTDFTVAEIVEKVKGFLGN